MTFRGFSLLAVLVASIGALIIVGDVDSAIGALAIGLIGGVVILAVEALPPGRLVLLTAICSLRCRRRLVRISVSYLYRIRVGNRYLLIRSARWPSTHAPVGGVYKRLPGSEPRLRKLGVLDDDLHPIDERSEEDLRVRVPGWRVISFYRWFDREEDRELSPWREFYEEMVEPGFVPHSAFPYLFHRRAGRRWSYPRWSQERKRFEMFVADIIEPVFSPEQEKIISAIPDSQDFRWASEEEIRACGVVPNVQPTPNISERAIWTL